MPHIGAYGAARSLLQLVLLLVLLLPLLARGCRCHTALGSSWRLHRLLLLWPIVAVVARMLYMPVGMLLLLLLLLLCPSARRQGSRRGW